MGIKIIKSGISQLNNRRYIIIEYPGSTKLMMIVRKYAKNYHPGMTGAMKQGNGKYHQVLWKRDKPLKSIKQINEYYNW